MQQADKDINDISSFKDDSFVDPSEPAGYTHKPGFQNGVLLIYNHQKKLSLSDAAKIYNSNYQYENEEDSEVFEDLEETR